jgi:oxygen-independent coproporphyrinogen-3 oxidase
VNWRRALASRRASRERTRIDALPGGGTPSRLGGDGVVDAIAAVRRYASVDESTEVTIEANPEDVTAAIVAQWVGAGVNRVSLGVQSFDPQVLAWMHRTHEVAAGHAAVDALAAGGIANWSLDLIYALPGEVPRDWARDLDAAIALEPTHLSAYGLTVESGTPLARWRERGAIHDADEECTNDPLAAHERLAAAGVRHHESRISALRSSAPIVLLAWCPVSRPRTGGPRLRRRHTAMERARVRALAGANPHGE